MLRAQSMSRAGRANFSFKEMRAMFQAISKGDSRAARKAAETHVKNASLAARSMVASAEARPKITPLKRHKGKQK
jgi:DNA-binding FadR family transcriptional regulator